MTDLARFNFLDPITDVKLDPTNAVIFGFPGAGKTDLAVTAPDPLIIDLEKGATLTARNAIARLKAQGQDQSNLRIAQITYSEREKGSAQDAIGQLESIMNMLRSGDHPFKTVVLDPISEFQKLLMAYVLEKFPQKRFMDQPTQADWGAALDMAKKYISELRALPLHTVVIAHAEVPGNPEEQIKPLTTGKTFGPYLEGAMPLLGYLYLERQEKEDGTHEDRRILQVDGTPRIRAKNRGGKLPPLIGNPNLTKIFQRMES